VKTLKLRVETGIFRC